MYVQGLYASGAHRAADPAQFADLGSPAAGLSVEDGSLGSGALHADRAILGAGEGRVYVINIAWGMGLHISIGALRAHGVWTFCDSETHPDCASP